MERSCISSWKYYKHYYYHQVPIFLYASIPLGIESKVMEVGDVTSQCANIVKNGIFKTFNLTDT